MVSRLFRSGSFHAAWFLSVRPTFLLGTILLTLFTGGQMYGLPPVNDECAGAITVGNGTFQANNADATTNGSASCGFGGISGSRDLWWRYVAPQSGTAVIDTIDVCDTAFSFDTVLSVFSACGGTELACNDDAGLIGCPIMARLEMAVSAESSYFIRIAEYQGRIGDYFLTISGPTGEGFCGDDLCNGAEDPCTCPVDGCVSTCGGACCDDTEDPMSCANDCATLADVALFQNSFTGTSGNNCSECDRFDFDADSRLDLVDFAQFISRMLVGP